jgi:hypothetical protein
MGFGSRATSHCEMAWGVGTGRQGTVRGHGIWEQGEKLQTEGVDCAAKGQATVGGHVAEEHDGKRN